MAKATNNGFDDLQKQLKKLGSNAKKLSNTKSVKLEELFTQKFMRAKTKFSSFDEMLNDFGYADYDENQFNAIPDDEINRKVAATTRFKTFQEMLDDAAVDYANKILDS